MGWRELDAGATAQDTPSWRGHPARLYAAEDIEDEVVFWLRAHGVDICSARDMGHRGKPVAFHAGLSVREKRFLLTKNAREFLDDLRYPYRKIYGVVVLDGDLGPGSASYGVAAGILLRQIVPFGDVFTGCKIRVGDGAVEVSGPDEKGLIRTSRFRIDPDRTYEWVDD